MMVEDGEVSLLSSLSSSPELKSKSRERQELTILRKAMASKKTPGWSSRGWHKSVSWKWRPLSTGGSQRSQEQRSTDTAERSMWKDTTKIIYEAGLTIKDQNHTRGTGAAKKVRQGRKTCGCKPKSHDHRKQRQTEAGKPFLRVSDA